MEFDAVDTYGCDVCWGMEFWKGDCVGKCFTLAINHEDLPEIGVRY